MPSKTYHVLGLMSGSSLDGLDIAFCNFSINTDNKSNVVEAWKLESATTKAFSKMWQSRLLNLPEQDGLTLSKTHTYLGHYMGELINAFIHENGIVPDFIASHGHTIYHYPEKRVTIQIGDGAAIAATTGFPVICDFRTQDVAINGEGAPLAPLADKLLFSGHDFFLNLGGIANITCNAKGRYIAFDIGAANQVLNALALELNLEYDKGGAIAQGGKLLPQLLDQINAIPYFQQPYPKSLDNQWVQNEIVPLYMASVGSWADKLRTACEQLAQQTAIAIEKIIERESIQKKNFTLMATGGGAFNTFLMESIQKHCAKICEIKIIIPNAEIVQFKEAILMALMGVLRIVNIPNCLSSATGAKFDTIGGAIYQGHKKLI